MNKFIIVMLFFAQNFWAQNIIGSIYDNVEKPIANVSIYIDGSKSNTTSDENGSFTLDYKNLKNSTLVFSKEGYQTVSYPVSLLIDKKAKVLLEREQIIKEVVLIPYSDKIFEDNYARFFSLFIGNNSSTSIKNKKDLLFAVNPKNRTFLVKAKKPLIVINNDLGYEMIFNLIDFAQKSDTLTYTGTSFYKEMKGNKSTIKKWKENRKKAYLGSPMHFFRSIDQGKVMENKFNVNKARRIKNPNYPSESELKELTNYYKNLLQSKNSTIQIKLPEDLQKIFERKNKNTEYMLQIYKTKISETEYTKKKEGSTYLSFEDLLQVVYITDDKKIIDTLLDNPMGNEFLIYPSGIISNPTSLLFNGTWTNYTINTMLPLDFDYDNP